MDHIESRYSSLIQPIKDLAANWDIDIAESLTNYLEDLDHLRISVDGKSELNFAEAALLIQGSTAVYSKKVEYLYQLVVQSLEFITSKKSSLANSKDKVANENGNTLEEDSLLFENDVKYLLLDHMIEKGKNIDMNISINTNTSTRNSVA
jgi:condensin-2 complex subunit H2